MRAPPALLVVLLVSWLSACQDPTPPRPLPPSPLPTSPGTGPSAAPPLEAFEVRDRSVVEVASRVATAARVALVLDPDASMAARCARVSMFVPAGTPPPELVRLLGEAVRGHGMRLEASGTGWVVRRDPATPLPESCQASGPLAPFAVAATSPGPEVAAIVAGIFRRSDAEAFVTREARDALFESAGVLARSVRVVPYLRNGEAVGVRLFGIRPDGVAAALGLHNGDVVLRANGRSLAGPDGALDAWSRARADDAIEIDLERRGQPVTLRIRVVPRLPSR